MTQADALRVGMEQLIEKLRRRADDWEHVKFTSHIGPLHGVGFNEARTDCAEQLSHFADELAALLAVVDRPPARPYVNADGISVTGTGTNDVDRPPADWMKNAAQQILEKLTSNWTDVRVEQCASIIAAHAQRPPAEPLEWQDIATAPRYQRRQILAVIGKRNEVRVICWHGGGGESGLDGRWVSIGGIVVKPTHWMPLPAPPALTPARLPTEPE